MATEIMPTSEDLGLLLLNPTHLLWPDYRLLLQTAGQLIFNKIWRHLNIFYEMSWFNPQVGKNFAVLNIFFMWYLRDPPLHKNKNSNIKVLPEPLTDSSAWVCFCISSPQQGVKYQLWYMKNNFVEGGLYKYHMKNILRMAKFLPTWGLNQRYCPGL